ncbi:DoxX family membrane protein [Phytomonospora endophytica]|uniref:DoxX family membrane protein n=1 Tax=Phytomonospora endophytica TaxID=714109 RepID=UPI0035709CCE
MVTPAAVTDTGAGGETVPMHEMTLGMAVTSGPGRFFFGLARILLGWVFFWAFLDKLFGLGYATESANSWINGGSPTSGYLNGVDGPFASFFNSMAGQAWADWLFMIGLAGIGLALILGIGVWLAALTGTVLLVFMWMASLPMTQNPFLDEHLVYAVVLLGLAFVRGGDTLGLGKPWARSGLVRALPFLR